MIQEVSRKLKEKRETLGYSIEYVVEKTKIYPSTIRDIEAGNWANMSPTYFKGFMKVYASFLGVDIGKTLEEPLSLKLTPEKPATKVEGKEPPTVFIRIKNLAKTHLPQIKKTITIGLIAIVAAVILFNAGRVSVRKISALFRRHEKKVQQKNVAVSLKPGREREGVAVSLTSRKKCFLTVIVDGRVVYRGALNQGAVESWKAAKAVEMRISDGSAVYIEVNGKSIPTLTAIHRPIKSLKITSSGITVDK